ncbi:hypothetical protein FS935_02170 [Metabacillus litoralis]|uniref:Uncharacterized protein n=1 Tax=Metabacillus litoralis TaxID=152268 RepID=A0A5C6W5E6_9BACI|nr:hypothetical protein [Metabacillus litoralis]TXC93021.1 hypothetical protein FS935_02170 [Metabacillus litoralis]
MSKNEKEKVIKVDTLVIHAKEVKIVNEREEVKEESYERRDPWGLFWGRRPVEEIDDEKVIVEADVEEYKD